MAVLVLSYMTKEERLEQELRDLNTKVGLMQESLDKVRKGQFAKIGAVTKQCEATLHELQTLKLAMVRCQ